MGEKDSKADSRTENVEYNEGSSSSVSSQLKHGDDIQMAVRSGSTAHVTNTAQAIDIAKDGGWEADALIKELEDELERTTRRATSIWSLPTRRHSLCCS
jgi:hypothetical protein